MKKYALVLLIIHVLIIAATAQTAPKYPKGWANFVAEDRSFAILLPELTNVQESEIKKANNLVNLLGGKKIYSKISFLGDVNFGFSYQDFSNPPLDDLDREAQLESLTESMGEKTGDISTVIALTEDLDPKGDTRSIPLKTEKVKGVQTVKEVGEYYFFNRFFIVQQRLFRLLAVVPKKNVEANRDNILQFFNSLRIAQIPPAKNAAMPLPPSDFKIISKDGKFESGTLKLAFQFPQNWKTEFYDPNQQILTPKQQPEYDKEKAGLRWIWRNRQAFAIARSESTTSVISLLVNRLPHSEITLDEFVADRARLYAVKIAEKEIKGTRFLVLDTRDQGIHYFTRWNDYFLEIFLWAQNKEDLQLMEESLRAISN